MYIINQKKTEIVNTDFVERFLIVEQPDAVLIVLSYNSDRKPITLARYPTREDADAVMSEIFSALANGQKSYDVPEKNFFQEYHKKMDARVKRKGGS